jgi:dTDP-4-amino-4,6-dideoxygalactose transaminase
MQADSRQSDPGFLPAFYKLAFLSGSRLSGKERERLSARFQEQGVLLAPAFPALHLTHAQSRWTAPFSLTHAEQLSQRLMTLHHTHLLRAPDEIDSLATVIRSVLQRFEADSGDVRVS